MLGVPKRTQGATEALFALVFLAAVDSTPGCCVLPRGSSFGSEVRLDSVHIERIMHVYGHRSRRLLVCLSVFMSLLT